MKKKNKLLLRKRCLTVFSVFIVALASINVWAQPASEYCRWLYGTGNNAARFTWNTETNGNVTITIYSAIDGETAGQTSFRGQGWSNDRVTANLWVDVSGGTTWDATTVNTGNRFFTRTISSDLTTITLIPAQTIPDGAKIRYNSATEYKTSLDGNLWPSINFIWTYGSTKQCPDPAPLPAPENVAVDAFGNLTFDAVANAVSYQAIVYAGSIPYYTEANANPAGTILTFANPGAYTVKVKAIGDDNLYLNSLESTAVEWTIPGTIPEQGDSEYCYYYWDPSGTGSGVGSDDAVILTWETLENGNISVTMASVGGNGAAFRAGSLTAGNFKLGPAAVGGEAYLNTAYSGNVCTITPKAGVTLPESLSIQYQGIVAYLTTGGANPSGNLYPTGNFTYTYGSDCANLERTKLAAPTGVSVDDAAVLTFDPVTDAATYNAFVYIGTNLVYQQISVTSGDVLNFPLPGTFNVHVTSIPDVSQMSEYEESDLSDPFAWTVNYQTPATVPASPYCDFLVNPNGDGNSIPNNNAEYGDYDATYWSWTTDAEGQIVISINSALHDEYTPTTTFRATGMALNGFRIGDVRGDFLLEKVGDNTGKTQTFRAKEGIILLPGVEITYNGKCDYLLVTPNPLPAGNGNIADLYPTLTFSTPYIYGSNCSGSATILDAPDNLVVTDNALSFGAVENAVTYKVYVYNAEGVPVFTQSDFAPGNALTYDVPGHYTVKAQAIGNAGAYINSALSEATAWDLTAALAKPAGLKINTENKLTFTPVLAAVSYTVTIYAAEDDTTPIETISEFESGTALDLGDENYGTTYYVKVQAIGDGDVILDSELSDAYTWNFNEPYVCNLLLDEDHLLIPGSDDTAPYFAPGWVASANYTFDVSNNVISIHLGAATGAEWQAQFRILPTTPIILKAGESYEIKAKVRTSKNTSIYAKIFDHDDNAFIELISRQTLAATEGTVFGVDAIVPPTGLSRIFQILFDFGGNPADIDIEISDFVICGEEGTMVGIENIKIEPVGVYPVPAKDILYVNGLSTAKEIRIADVSGRTVAAPRISNESIDVSGLAKGIYILSIDGRTVKFTKN
ncbi:MAG: T9SS type A sorting domain-containing protein [Prevotellaceae bacterium]|jgi:hypothetical protein|nr:T9SS type A sorting domain-containing protein [Prevotellaceae bacterium]